MKVAPSLNESIPTDIDDTCPYLSPVSPANVSLFILVCFSCSVFILNSKQNIVEEDDLPPYSTSNKILDKFSLQLIKKNLLVEIG